MGIRDRKPAAKIRQFAYVDFLPFCRSLFTTKLKTLSYYDNGTARLLEYAPIADESLDTITTEKISGYARRRRDAGMKIATVNRELQVLRRMFALAMEWGRVERVLPRVKMIPGEAHRDRILSTIDEKAYLDGAQAIGTATLEAYQKALAGIQACDRRQPSTKPRDECFRLRWEQYRDAVIEITYGKTDNARRRIPVFPRAQAILEIRRSHVDGPWIFPAPTKSGYIEPSNLPGRHAKDCKLTKLEHFPLYTFRHTCPGRWPISPATATCRSRNGTFIPRNTALAPRLKKQEQR